RPVTGLVADQPGSRNPSTCLALRSGPSTRGRREKAKRL
ncbi:MAG: hypothetical protein ACI9EZ_000469, partial [Halobacteriales archaeon]